MIKVTGVNLNMMADIASMITVKRALNNKERKEWIKEREFSFGYKSTLMQVHNMIVYKKKNGDCFIKPVWIDHSIDDLKKLLRMCNIPADRNHPELF